MASGQTPETGEPLPARYPAQAERIGPDLRGRCRPCGALNTLANRDRESLSLLWAQGDQACSIRSLIGLAQVAVTCDEPALAAGLLATADLLREDADLFSPPYVRATAAACERAVQARMGKASYAAARATARSRPVPQAIAIALDVAAELAMKALKPPMRPRPTAGLTQRELDVLRLMV